MELWCRKLLVLHQLLALLALGMDFAQVLDLIELNNALNFFRFQRAVTVFFLPQTHGFEVWDLQFAL
jgi:hypothetical protein